MTVPGLGISASITPALVPTVTFGPTLGLNARRINKLGLDIRSFRVPLTTAIKEVIAPSIRHNFDVGGRPTWYPLAPATQLQRLHNGFMPTKPILMRTRKLYRVAGQLNIWDITTTTAVIRDLPQKVWYGKVHQEGLGRATTKKIPLAGTNRSIEVQDFGAGVIPARQFFKIFPDDEVQVHRVFDEWLQMRVRRAMAGR